MTGRTQQVTDKLLVDHFRRLERVLQAQGDVLSSSGNSVNKGLARESFLSQFLVKHLGTSVGIGTGEIVDRNSKAGERRPQIDIIIYNKDFPKIHYGENIDCFLAESVIATIEVKSRLNQDELRKAIKSARIVKSLQREIEVLPGTKDAYKKIRILPPSILSYVVAYKGPNIYKVPDIINGIYSKMGVHYPDWSDLEKRTSVPSPSLDGVFILGEGHMFCSNTAFGPELNSDEDMEKISIIKWFQSHTPDANLLMLFWILMTAVSLSRLHVFEPVPYINEQGLKLEYKGWYPPEFDQNNS